MPNDGNETFDMEHLLELAEEKKYRLLKEELVELNEVDIASFIEELDSERTVIVFRMLPKALATEGCGYVIRVRAADAAGDRGICRASGGQAEPHHQQHHR